jgi:glycine reductase
MRLEIGEITVSDVQFGESTQVKNGTLYVNKDALAEIAGADERIKSVEYSWPGPGSRYAFCR